jgi:hypothetical protein
MSKQIRHSTFDGIPSVERRQAAPLPILTIRMVRLSRKSNLVIAGSHAGA